MLLLTKQISSQNTLSKFPDWWMKGIMRTSGEIVSGEIDFCFRLKLKVTLVESTYPSQCPQCPFLFPHFLLFLTQWATKVLRQRHFAVKLDFWVCWKHFPLPSGKCWFFYFLNCTDHSAYTTCMTCSLGKDSIIFYLPQTKHSRMIMKWNWTSLF